MTPSKTSPSKQRCLRQEKKKVDRDFQSCGITAPPPASACPYLVAASRHRYGPQLQTETMNRFQTWPSRRGSGRSPRRSRSAPLREHPRAKAQAGRGGALARPAPGLRLSLAEAVRTAPTGPARRGGGACPAARHVHPRKQSPGRLTETASWRCRLATAVASVPRLRGFLSQQRPTPRPLRPPSTLAQQPRANRTRRGRVPLASCE